MASSNVWLSLASGAPGLGGPFVQEQYAPYRAITAPGAPKPRVVMAIGSWSKRQHLEAGLSVSYVEGEEQMVTLRRPQGVDAVLIDCELHCQRRAPRVRGGPRPGDMATLELRGAAVSPARIAKDMYFRVLAPFSDVVLLFAADLGGLRQTAYLLARWLRLSMRTPLPFWPQFIIIGVRDETEVFSLVVSRLLADLHASEPLDAYTAADVSKMAHDCLRLVVLEEGPPASVCTWLVPLLEQAYARRQSAGMAFSATHWKELCHLALAQYAASPSEPINFCSLARTTSPLPSDAATHLASFVRAGTDSGLDVTAVVASALCLDAYPPNMHPFPADMLFSTVYEKTLVAVQRAAKAPDFVSDVTVKFLDVAAGHLGASTSLWEGHLALLESFKTCWESIPSDDSCWVCLIRGAVRTLECRHRLCGPCVAACGEQAGSAELAIEYCPLCQQKNATNLCMRPPTAGNRVLSLGGGSPDEMLSFLHSLEKAVDVKELPLRKLFDTVIGTDVGAFFAITMFLEGWNVDDCKSHISRVTKPFYSMMGSVRFGHRLKWRLREVTRANEVDVVVLGKNRLYSNLLEADARSLSEDSLHDDFLGSDDVFVQYSAALDSGKLISSIASRLTVSLFYIELVSVPDFYQSPQTCKLVLRCRVAPGTALQALLSKLCRQRTWISYGADKSQFQRLPLCTSEMLDACHSWPGFARELDVGVDSLSSPIDVAMEMADGVRESVSRCPYQLGDLIRDQGLGRRESSVSSDSGCSVTSESGCSVASDSGCSVGTCSDGGCSVVGDSGGDAKQSGIEDLEYSETSCEKTYEDIDIGISEVFKTLDRLIE